MRLIDADELEKLIESWIESDEATSTNCAHRMSLACIRTAPTIDAVEVEKYNALKLLVEWAIECGFGYDNIPEEYELYKDEVDSMDYTEGLIYIAEKEVNSK